MLLLKFFSFTIKSMKRLFLFLFLALTVVFWALPAKAVCPVCTIAVVSCVGLAQWLGIDDTISGLWIGGFTVSLIIWTLSWMKKKNINFLGREIITVIAYYLLIVAPLFCFAGVINPLNTLWGINKFLIGIVLGSIFFPLGSLYYNYLKKKNNGHAYFPFQKVVMPILPLVILSLIFYFLTK